MKGACRVLPGWMLVATAICGEKLVQAQANGRGNQSPFASIPASQTAALSPTAKFSPPRKSYDSKIVSPLDTDGRRIYEIDLGGTGLRRLTTDAENFIDRHSAILPQGGGLK